MTTSFDNSLFPSRQKGVIKAVVFRDAKDLKDDPSIHLAAAAAAAAAAYGRHSVNICADIFSDFWFGLDLFDFNYGFS